jgi:hypothetical protein
VIGLVILIIGFIVFQIETVNNKPHTWYSWTLIVVGSLLTLGGAILLVFTYKPS